MTKSEKPIIEDFRQQYRQIIQKQTNALLELSSAHDEESAIREQFKSLGLDVSLLDPVQLRYVGSIHNPNSYASCVLKQTMSAGHLIKTLR